MEIHSGTANSKILAYRIFSSETQPITSETNYSVTYSHPQIYFGIIYSKTLLLTYGMLSSGTQSTYSRINCSVTYSHLKYTFRIWKDRKGKAVLEFFKILEVP